MPGASRWKWPWEEPTDYILGLVPTGPNMLQGILRYCLAFLLK